jgi:hypothetical protein
LSAAAFLLQGHFIMLVPKAISNHQLSPSPLQEVVNSNALASAQTSAVFVVQDSTCTNNMIPADSGKVDPVAITIMVSPATGFESSPGASGWTGGVGLF